MEFGVHGVGTLRQMAAGQVRGGAVWSTAEGILAGVVRDRKENHTRAWSWMTGQIRWIGVVSDDTGL